MDSTSRTFELKKVGNSFVVCEIQVKDIPFSLGAAHCSTNKWLHLEDWFEIETELQVFLNRLQASEFLKDFETHEFFTRGGLQITCKRKSMSKLLESIFGSGKPYLSLALDIYISKFNTKQLIGKIFELEQLKYTSKRKIIAENLRTLNNDFPTHNALNFKEFIMDTESKLIAEQVSPKKDPEKEPQNVNNQGHHTNKKPHLENAQTSNTENKGENNSSESKRGTRQSKMKSSNKTDSNANEADARSNCKENETQSLREEQPSPSKAVNGKAAETRANKILNLNHLSLDQILASFTTLKPKLDEIFAKYASKTTITGHEGVNCMKTLNLLDDKHQIQMMHHLREHYKNRKNVPALTDLIINALLPEWTLNLFMDEHKMTRKEAINKLRAQEELLAARQDGDDLNFITNYPV